MTTTKEARAFLMQVGDAKKVYLQCRFMQLELKATQNITTGFERGYDEKKKESYTRLKEGTGRSNVKHDTSDLIVAIEKESQEVEQARQNWLSKRREIKKTLRQIDEINEDMRTVLILKYVGMREWDEIAAILKKSYPRIQQIHLDGLKVLASWLAKL